MTLAESWRDQSSTSATTESRHYVMAPSITSRATGFYVTKPILAPVAEFMASPDYAELKRQVHEACQAVALYLAKNGGEVSTWVNGRCISTTTGRKRAIQQSIVSEGEPCEIEESIRRAVAASSALPDQAGPGKHRRDERGGAGALDQGRVHHPGQQSLFEVRP